MYKGLLAFCLLVGLFEAASSQSIQTTIRRGSQANSVVVIARATANLSAAPTNIQFTIGVPTGGARPVMTITSNRYASHFELQSGIDRQTASDGGYFIYLVNLAVPTYITRNLVANQLDTIAELSFAGLNTSLIGDLRLMQLPDGEATTGAGIENGQYNTYLEFNGVDRTHVTQRFFSNSGGVVQNNASLSALSFVTVGSGVVPVQWISFDVFRVGEQHRLSWQVVEDNETLAYDVERSWDGVRFEPIQRITAVGGVATRQYSFTDAVAAPGGVPARYYRIRQTDRDGQVSYSITRSIRHNSQPTWSIFPNPVKDGFTIQVPAVSGVVCWSLVGSNGQVLLQKNLGAVMAGPTYVDLRSLRLSTGLYHVQVFVDEVRVVTLPVWVVD